jgi:hypothetical protein
MRATDLAGPERLQHQGDFKPVVLEAAPAEASVVELRMVRRVVPIHIEALDDSNRPVDGYVCNLLGSDGDAFVMMGRDSRAWIPWSPAMSVSAEAFGYAAFSGMINVTPEQLLPLRLRFVPAE